MFEKEIEYTHTCDYAPQPKCPAVAKPQPQPQAKCPCAKPQPCTCNQPTCVCPQVACPCAPAQPKVEEFVDVKALMGDSSDNVPGVKGIGEKTAFSYITIVLIAVLLAFNYYIFIVTNSFAPAGLNGIATMIQYKTGFSISYMSLIINLPLCLISLFIVGKEYAAKSTVFTVFYSAIYLLLQKSDLHFLQYVSGGHDSIFPVIISGVISGFVCGISFKNNSNNQNNKRAAKQ